LVLGNNHKEAKQHLAAFQLLEKVPCHEPHGMDGLGTISREEAEQRNGLYLGASRYGPHQKWNPGSICNKRQNSELLHRWQPGFRSFAPGGGKACGDQRRTATARIAKSLGPSQRTRTFLGRAPAARASD
ncbi:unnamed protein product, partial [Effrenium voratum]